MLYMPTSNIDVYGSAWGSRHAAAPSTLPGIAAAGQPAISEVGFDSDSPVSGTLAEDGRLPSAIFIDTIASGVAACV